MTTKNETQNSINKNIYQKLLQLIPNLPEHLAQGKEYGKSQSDGFMDLSYDFLHEDKKGEYIIALHHYFEMNGDLVPDPDMEIRVIPEKEIANALSFQNQIIYQHVEEGTVHLQNDLNEFLEQWLDNALSQAHKIDLSKEREELNHDDEMESEKEIELKNIRDNKERGEERFAQER